MFTKIPLHRLTNSYKITDRISRDIPRFKILSFFKLNKNAFHEILRTETV